MWMWNIAEEPFQKIYSDLHQESRVHRVRILASVNDSD